MSTTITAIGTVATEPTVIGAGSQTAFCTFRLASTERRYSSDKGEWVDGHTNWFSINAFRGLGEHAKGSLRKGDRIVVTGRLRVRKWESGEKSGTTAEIEAEGLGHDLRWGTTSFAKRTGSAPAEHSGPVPQDRTQQDRAQPGAAQTYPSQPDDPAPIARAEQPDEAHPPF